MRSYLDILNELKEAVEADSIPKKEKEKIDVAIEKLFELLWKFSD